MEQPPLSVYVATARYLAISAPRYDATPVAVATAAHNADADIRGIVDRLTVLRELDASKWVIQSARLCSVKEG